MSLLKKWNLLTGNQKTKVLDYDKENLQPVLKCSICTGEQVVGFKNIRTGKFEEVKMIQNNKELQDFMELYGLKFIPKEY